MIKFCKVRDVKSPVRSHDSDAGIDFFIPNWSNEFYEDLRLKNKKTWIDEDYIIVESKRSILIPSGIKVNFPYSHALIAFNKSGVASKLGLDIGASVIDSDYKGEVHINLINTSDRNVYLEYGQKIVQFILIPIKLDIPQEITEAEYIALGETERGSGGFGSTGIK
jgi:dUTP pyrophosphatase